MNDRKTVFNKAGCCLSGEKQHEIKKGTHQKNSRSRACRLLTVLMLVLLGMCVCSAASAAVNDLTVTAQLSTKQLSAPEEITITLTVSNAGESDMPGPVTMYYPNGKQVEEFGAPTLEAGNSATWTGPWKVTSEQLEAGRITFKIRYSIYDESGELVNKTKSLSMAIGYTGAVTNLEVNRTITPTTAREGQEVSVTYEVVNTGTVDVTNVSIKENSSISTKKAELGTIAPGEKGTYTFTAVMKTKDLTSEATISYQSSTQKGTQTVKKAAQTIKYGEVKLTATLTADKKGGKLGENCTLTLKLKNTGNADFTDVTVTDAVLGEVFTGKTVAAGQTETLTVDVPLNDTQDYQFTVSGHDSAGNEVSTATERVTLIALDPAQAITLSLTAKADREVVYTVPAVVKFTFRVTNESSQKVENVKVSAGSMTLYTFDSIEPGATETFVRDVSISMDGTYQFKATCKDQLGQTLSFDSNSTFIIHSQPTAVPTEAPIVTPPAPTYEPVPVDEGLGEQGERLQVILGYATYVLLGLSAVFALLGVIGVIGGLKKINRDQLPLRSTRQYFKKAGRKRNEVYDAMVMDAQELQEEPEPAADEAQPEAAAEPPAPQAEVPEEDPDMDPMEAALRKLNDNHAYYEGIFGHSDEFGPEPEDDGEQASEASVPRRRRR